MVNSTNDKIRYVAFRLFLEKGYEATNIRDICKEVGIKASSLYFYYSSKKELFFSIYDEIWSMRIKKMSEITEARRDMPPNLKLSFLYRKMMEYYSQEMVKQKFLLRYHLFPPEEVSDFLRQRFDSWSDEENQVVLEIIEQCLKEKELDGHRLPKDYLQEYKTFENSRVIEMVVSNIRKNEKENERLWVRFWNCRMLNE